MPRPDRALHLAGRTVRDLRAVRSGRIAERVANRLLGRLASHLLRGLWK